MQKKEVIHKKQKLKNKPLYQDFVNQTMNTIIFSREKTIHAIIFHKFRELQLFEYLCMEKLANTMLNETLSLYNFKNN